MFSVVLIQSKCVLRGEVDDTILLLNLLFFFFFFLTLTPCIYKFEFANIYSKKGFLISIQEQILSPALLFSFLSYTFLAPRYAYLAHFCIFNT